MDQHAYTWRPTRHLSRRVLWPLWLLCLVLTPGALLLDHTSSPQLGGLGPTRLAGTVTFLWLLIGCLWPTREQRPRALGGTLVTALVVHLLTAAAVGDSWFTAAHVAVAVVVQGAVTLGFYRWRIGDEILTPHRPDDVVELAVASLVGATVATAFGPGPGVWLTSPGVDQLWWIVLSTGYVFVGSACVMLLVQRRPRAEAVRTRVLDVYVQLLVTSVCIGVVFVFDGLPLTWIVLLPAIWAGLTLGPWTSAAYALTGAVTVAVIETFPRGGGDDLPALSEVMLLHSLMGAFVFVVLLLSLGRDQRAHLADEVVRRRQEALDQAGLLGTVFRSIHEALVLLDSRGGVQLHNPAALEILGPERLHSEPGRWLGQMDDRRSFTYSFNRDGSEDGVRALAVRLAPVQYAGADGTVAIVRDVTTEQRRIEELASFAAVAAHDLKSPLAAVQGWIEVAEDALDTDVETTRLALGRGRHATDRMTTEIEDWLTYNVAREGALQPVPTPLQPFVEMVVTTFPVGFDIVVDTPDTVLVDPTLMRHLLVNLIGNAVKYTEPGQRASIAVRSSSDATDRVRIAVSDAGIGIPVGEETAVFEPFRRATGVQGTYEGSGLGLALCKRIVRRHGGQISAERNHGPGTTVTVTLPRGQA